MFLYDCPHCNTELKGSYGDDVYCKKCNITLETDWDMELFDDGDESHWAWLTGVEHKGKNID